VAAPTSAFCGTLRSVLVTEDTETFAFRPERRPARGVLELALALVLAGASLWTVARLRDWRGWALAAVPLLACAVTAARGLAWLWPRPMFTVTLDRRARTLLLSMPTDRGQGLAKTRYADVLHVELAERDGAHALSLPLADGRRLGLGFFRRAEDVEPLASRFAEWIGVPVRRPS
jgi:hypothetical protein